MNKPVFPADVRYKCLNCGTEGIKTIMTKLRTCPVCKGHDVVVQPIGAAR